MMKYSNIFRLTKQFQIVLASKSPRRVKLLREMGVDFTQIIPQISEINNQNEKPFSFACRLAEEKAKAIKSNDHTHNLIIGCDTIVVLGNKVLGKPENKEHAFQILNSLTGKQHIVCTALAIALENNILKSGFELTKVFFNSVSEEEIQDYIETGEPMDKAGAYGIQGMGAFLVDRIEGNLDTVIGLPCHLLDKLARETIVSLRLSD